MMIFWVTYFILVVYLHLFQTIAAHAFLNLFLCIFVFFPIPDTLKKKKTVIIFRNIIGIILGAVLLWHESYLPSFSILINFIINPELRPSPEFLLKFIFSEINLKIFLVIALTLVFAYLLSYTKLKKYFSLFFLICFFIIGFTERSIVSGDLLGTFYETESKKIINITNNPSNNFDIVIVQLCSFSWDDLSYVNYDIKPFLNQFDYLFTNFNTATSYSNPSVIRLLRSTCGQTSHEAIFTDVNSSCYLMQNLNNAGYSTYTLLNHDGVYAGFNEAITKYGKAGRLINNTSLKPEQISFDGTSIYNDREVLSLWLETRKNDISKNAAVFYNGTSLHTGGHYVDSPYLTNGEQYKIVLNSVLGDLNNFFEELKRGEKNTIVIIIGEHGAALRGSALQPATVREIPLPDITKVPVAIKIFGPRFNGDNRSPIIIKESASYFSMAQLLAKIIETSPTDSSQLPQPPEIQASLPELVSENESGVILQNQLGLFYRLKKYKTWDIIPGSKAVKSLNNW
jgi:hypothetical protein